MQVSEKGSRKLGVLLHCLLEGYVLCSECPYFEITPKFGIGNQVYLSTGSYNHKTQDTRHGITSCSRVLGSTRRVRK